MNGITILIWITIAIIGVIAIILVKLHYKGDELEKDEGSIIQDNEIINGILSSGKDKIKRSNTPQQSNSLFPQSNPNYQSNSYIQPQDSLNNDYDVYVVPEAENNSIETYEYETPNQVLINYKNEVEKFQEPIKQNQMDIMTQNNKDKTELKDLFTIDELIKESKRKDNEREKEAQKINTDSEDLTEIKESIENPVEESLIEEIIDKELSEETISDLINEDSAEEVTEDIPKINPESAATQKDIEEVINTASQENEKDEIENISESDNITDVLLNSEDDSQDIPNEEIKEPALKTPSKVGENKDYKLGASIDDANLFGDDDKEMDLDYRKDLDRFTNKIKGSKIFQEVKDKIVQEKDEIIGHDESYIRKVNEYDEYEPIINETHVDYDELHVIDADQRLRQENTRRVFNMAKNSTPEPELAQPVGAIKEKPARDNIKISINNNDLVLKPGDEIIYNHLGETYSSQVYAINGDDISVKYRRKNITIKPEDVKKIY